MSARILIFSRRFVLLKQIYDQKYECMNNAWECYWSRSAAWSFSCGWKINPIYWNEIGSCESVGEYCQPSTNTSTGKLDPFNYLDASGSIRPVYNQSGSISWMCIILKLMIFFSCSYSGLETLLCVPEILWKIWKRFTVALKNLLDFCIPYRRSRHQNETEKYYDLSMLQVHMMQVLLFDFLIILRLQVQNYKRNIHVIEKSHVY